MNCMCSINPDLKINMKNNFDGLVFIATQSTSDIIDFHA